MMIPLVFGLCLVGLPGDPPAGPVVTQADLIEINHYFDQDGKSVFDQLIFLDWDDKANRYNVVAWRLIKSPNQIPLRNPGTGKYSATWFDGKVLRTVIANKRVETWTQFDPETRERAFRAKSQRPDLVRPPVIR